MTNEFWNKNIRKISLLIIITVIVLILWSLVISPFLVFKSNEKIVLEAGKRFFEINRGMIPTGEKIVTIPLQKLYDKDMISDDLRNPYGSGLCDSKNSWIKAKKINGELNYYVYLKCGIYSSNIDHDGPVITLKGEDEIILNKGDKYEELGVDSVVDNTDGSIDVKKVKIDSSKVNTKKNGIYEVTYKIKDSMNNETIKIRTVKVEQVLSKIVKNDTKNTNGYYMSTSSNNYIQIDGMIFRILGVNSDETIKVVSEEPLATVDNDSVDKWLNDYFYNKLSDNAKKYIVNSKWCNEKITNPENYKKCNSYSSGKNVGLLSVADLNNTKDDDYMFGDTLGHQLLTSNDYYLDAENNFKKVNNSTLYGIRPVMNLKKDLPLTTGKGNNADPYKLPGQKSSGAGTKVYDLKPGEYINYSGYTWRVIGKDVNNDTQIVMTDVLLDSEEEQVVTSFDSKKKYYNSDRKTNIGYKIINNYSKYINTKLVKKYEYRIYKYNNLPKYDTNEPSNVIKTKFIEASMFELFGTDLLNNYWYRESNKNKAYANFSLIGTDSIDYDSTNAVKLSCYISNSTTVKSGKGTYASPYRLTK